MGYLYWKFLKSKLSKNTMSSKNIHVFKLMILGTVNHIFLLLTWQYHESLISCELSWCQELMLSNSGVGEDSWESLGCKEIKPVNPKGNQPWIFSGKIDAEVPIFWPPGTKSWLLEKDPDAGKDWGQEEKWVTEDEMVGKHYWLNGHEFEQTPGDREGQGSLVCSSPCKWD